MEYGIYVDANEISVSTTTESIELSLQSEQKLFTIPTREELTIEIIE